MNIGQTELSENEVNAALSVLQSGALRQGRICAEFEKEFSRRMDAKHAICCSSGSAALHLAYMSFLNPGDEVLVPSFTFFATGSMVNAVGGKPVFCDVDQESFLLDLDDAEKKITSKTRAISPVHLFGNPCDIVQVQEFAAKHNLRIVWDAAQAHGAKYNGSEIGGLSDYVCYSFYPSKNMFVGEGGMVCTEDDEMAVRLKAMREHGQTGKYYHTMLGLNYRMTEVEAAIGCEQLKRLDEMLDIRKRNAQRLNDGLSSITGLQTPVTMNNGEHAWHQYCVLIDEEEFGCDRDMLAKKLKDKDIGTAIHYPRGMHQQPVFEGLYGKTSLPVTEDLCSRILALPVHQGINVENVECITNAISEIHNR